MGEITLIVGILGLVAEVVAFIKIVSNMTDRINKIATGTKCHLRSEMLRIYYHHRTEGTIRQYEYENFVMSYEAYKALKGNSFIDKIYNEVQTWEVLS